MSTTKKNRRCFSRYKQFVTWPTEEGLIELSAGRKICLLCLEDYRSMGKEADNKIFIKSAGSSTNMIQKHLYDKHIAVEGVRDVLGEYACKRDKDLNNKSKQLTLHSFDPLSRQSGKRVLPPFNEVTLAEEVVRLCVNSRLPFNFALSSNFCDFVRFLRPTASNMLPKRRKLECTLTQTFEAHKKALKSFLLSLDCRFSLVIDGWTSKGSRGYIGMCF
jgi:hypothetical protein